jgi:hypothetical protein
MRQNYAGIGGYTSIVQGRNILATLVSGGRAGGGYSTMLTTNVSRIDFLANAPPALVPLVLTLNVGSFRLVKLRFMMEDNDSIEIDWGDNTTTEYANPADYNADPTAGQHRYDASGNYTVTISGLLTGFNGFVDASGATLLSGITNWGDLGLLSLDYACANIPNVPVPTNIPASVLSTRYMFYDASYNRVEISSWNVSNVTDMTAMFSRSDYNSNISTWFDSASYTGQVDISMNQMFANSIFNQNISNWLVRSTRHTMFSTGGSLTRDNTPTFVDGTQPTGLATTFVDISSVGLSWTNNNSPTFVRIQYKVNSSNTYTSSIIAAASQATVVGLTAGTTYDLRVAAYNANGWTIATPPLSVLIPISAPTGLTATAVSSTSIALSWTNTSIPSDTRIEVSVDETTWTIVSHPVLGAATTYTVTGLTALTLYRFRIATIGGSAVSNTSAPASAATLPNPPTNVDGVATSTTSITLTWVNASTPTESVIKYSTTQNLANAVTINVTGTTATRIITGLTAATTYYFTVQTRTSPTQISLPSAVETVTTKTTPVTNLAVTNNTTGTSVTLSWTDDPVATQYLIESDISGGAFTGPTYKFQLIDASSSTYTVTGLSGSTNYEFRVTNIKNDGYSDPIAVTARTVPSAPRNLTSEVIGGQIKLTWVITNSISTSTIIESEDENNPGTWNTLTSSAGNMINTLTIAPIAATGAFKYRVITREGLIESLPSNIVTVDASGTGPSAPIAPSDLTAVDDGSGNVILTWEVNDSNSDSTTVEYRLTGGTAFTVFPNLTILTNTATVTFEPLSFVSYDYRVITVVDGVDSDTSNVVALAVVDPDAVTTVDPPTDLTAVDNQAGQVTLEWTNVASTFTSTKIEYSLDDINWTAFGAVVAFDATPNNTVTRPPPATGALYYYRVTTVNGTAESTPSASDSVDVAALDQPTGLTVVYNGAGEYELSWSTTETSTSTKIQVSDTGTGGWADAVDGNGTISAAAEEVTITFTLTDLTQKYFQVITVVEGVESTPSASATNATLPQALTFTAADDGLGKADLTWDLTADGNAGNADFVGVEYLDENLEFQILQFDPENGNRVGINAGTVKVVPPLFDVDVTYRLMTVAAGEVAYSGTPVAITVVAPPAE